LDKYTNTPSYRIGLEVAEEIVNSDIDSTLNDNAQGFSNYTAAGADRLKIRAYLTKKPLDQRKYENFIELMVVNGGEITAVRKDTEYNEIGKEVKIFLDGLLVKRQTLSTSSTFSMAQEDYFIGASSNNGTGTESAIANKQFMGELHEMSMVNTTKKRFSINNLTPNINSTLFYFRFEEVDE
jgi:hypothetical protein